MATIQITVFHLDEFPPADRRSVDLSSLRSRLHADLVQLIGNRSGYVFDFHIDTLVGVTNGITRGEHTHVKESIQNRFPVTHRIGVATADTPKAALRAAAADLVSDPDPGVTDGRPGQPGATIDPAERGETDVEVARIGGAEAHEGPPPFDAVVTAETRFLDLVDYLYDTHASLGFAADGHMVAVTPGLPQEAYRSALDRAERSGMSALRVGIGRGPTAHRALSRASRALRACHRNGTRVETRDVEGDRTESEP